MDCRRDLYREALRPPQCVRVREVAHLTDTPADRYSHMQCQETHRNPNSILPQALHVARTRTEPYRERLSLRSTPTEAGSKGLPSSPLWAGLLRTKQGVEEMSEPHPGFL